MIDKNYPQCARVPASHVGNSPLRREKSETTLNVNGFFYFPSNVSDFLKLYTLLTSQARDWLRREGRTNAIRRQHCGIALGQCADFHVLLAFFSVTKFCCEEIVFTIQMGWRGWTNWSVKWGWKNSVFSHWFRESVRRQDRFQFGELDE